MKRKSMIFMVGLIALLFLAASCATESKTKKGAAYGAAGGAAAGAAAGQAIGGDTEGTLLGAGIGAAVGAAAGAGIGHMMNQQEEDLREELSTSEAASVNRQGKILAVTLQGDVTFASGSARVKPAMYDEINRIADILQQYPQTRIRVEGHTDNVGAEASNMELSRQRAAAVKNLLVRRGIASPRIEVAPFGESQPIAPNSTDAGRQQNRRVEIKVIPTAA